MIYGKTLKWFNEIDRQTYRQIDIQTYRQIDRQTGRQTDIKIDRQTDRQIDINFLYTVSNIKKIRTNLVINELFF